MKKITLLLFFATIATTMFAQVAAPTFNTAAGTYYNPFNIELTGSNIFYTLDGTTPTENSTKYTSAITISEFGTSTTITAASLSNGAWSDAISATYELKVAAPEFSIKGGIYEKITGNDALKFTTETEGATIYYNERGEDPKTSGSKALGALSILATKTIKAVAVVTDSKGNKIYSDVSSEYYIISPIALFTTTNEVESDNKYLINCDNKIASPFYEDTKNGDLKNIDIIVSNNKYIETNNFSAFKFVNTDNGYTIQDAYGRYLYIDQNSIYTNKRTSTTKAMYWNISIDPTTSQVTIKNISKGNIIAYNTQTATFGLYNESEIGENITLPSLFKNIEFPTIVITPEDGDTIKEFSKFTVTCDYGIIYEDLDDAYVHYKIGQDVTKNEFDNYEQIDENTIEFTLEEPIKKSDDYKVVFPENAFILAPDALNKTNKEFIARYTVLNKDILELIYSNPSNKETAASLQYLYFEFNQDIKINIENAIVTDKKGNEYTFTLSNIDSWGTQCLENALCLKTDEAIITPGEYTFELKKEYFCAKENNALTIEKDMTFRITILETLKLESVTPNDSTIYEKVENITLTFNKDVMHENITEIIVKDSNDQSYTFTKTTVEEKTKELIFTTNTPITAKDTYTFTIESNVIYCDATNSDLTDTESIPETTVTFVVTPKPIWWTNYDYTASVKEFEKLTISFENVSSIKLNEEVTPTLSTQSGANFNGTPLLITEEDEKDGTTTTKIEITFEEKQTSADTCYVTIPAGLFTMNEDVINEEKVLTFKIVAPGEVTPLEATSVTPKFGDNGQLEEIEIVYNQQVYFGNPEYEWSSYVVYLTDANGEKHPMWQKDPYDPTTWAQIIPSNTVVLIPVKLNAEGYPYEYNDYGQVTASPITTVGEYTLNLADVTVRYGYDPAEQNYSTNGCCEGIYTWTISDTAIDNIEAETENTVIYDLTGRRVNYITKAGIYIVNGKKTIVK